MNADATPAVRAAHRMTVAAPAPATHVYALTLEVAPFSKPVSGFDLVLPAWAPGSYAIRDFARNVRDLSVAGPDGAPLDVAKTEKARWRVALPRPAVGPFTVRYRVYANELSVRTSHLDSSHAYGNGTSLFLYVDGRKDEPVDLRFDLPAGWKASVALPGAAGLFHARDYDELADSPFECGTHRLLAFEVRGVRHEVAIWGSGNEDAGRLLSDLARIAETTAAIFGGLPYERYLFILHLAAGAGGGLEHRASQTSGFNPWKFRPEKSYRDVLYLLSHELFHAWNVKRIRPAALGPFDYTREVHTKDLWALEGVTSYYEGLIPLRAGLVSAKHVFAEWMKELKEHRDQPGSAVQSAESASFDSWIRFYKPDENSPNVSESYYRRGQLLGLAFDLLIRHETKGARSLDDALRSLWRRWGSRDQGYPDGEWERALSEALGRDARPEFDRWVRGTETPPFESLVAPFGLRIVEKAEKEDDESKDGEDGKGDGVAAAGPEEPKKADPLPREKADFGWTIRTEKDRLVVASVLEGRAAMSAGLSAGDEIVALDGSRASEEQVKRIRRDVAPGTTVAVTVFRRDRLETIPLRLGAKKALTYELQVRKDAPPEAKALYDSWTGPGGATRG